MRLEELGSIAGNAFLAGKAGFTAKHSEDMNTETLPISRRSLLCFSLNQWLAPAGQLRADLVSGIFSNIEFCRILHGLAVTSHHLLCEQHLTEVIIESLILLVSQYTHANLDLPSRIDLRAHLLHAARGEPALHVLKPFYRDHFFHALEVCFLGHVLLETKLDDDRYLWNLVLEQIGGEGDKQKVLSLWYLAALLHDIGYAMDVLNSSRKYLSFFRHSKALRRLDKRFKRAITRLSKEKEVEKLGINIRDGIEHDHGIIGALHLRSLIENIAQDSLDLDVDEYMPAIQAIALHNLRRHDDTVSFAEQPLAFLLAVCDQLQEWRRPRLMFSTSPNWLLSRLAGASSDYVSLEGAFKAMTANLEVLPGEPYDINLRFRSSAEGRPHLAFVLEYDEQINRNSGVFQLWLDATLNFQRLDFEGLPLDISVTYTTPFYKCPGSDAILRQLHRLRDAAHETHMSFLADWFPASQEEDSGVTLPSDKAVTYRCDDRERLTLNLRNLSHRALMTRGMDAFWQCLKEWKNFNDDRDFPGDYAPVIPA